MRVKLNWLNEFVEISDISIEEIINVFTLYSTEVEGSYDIIGGTNLVVGHVLSTERMVESDYLSICRVDIGKEVLQIVCGAPNIESNQYVIVAKPGARLPGGYKIKKIMVRGTESNGMICSLEELGLEKKYIPEEYQNGIFYFKNKVQIGSDPLKALDFNDKIIELGVTPNRGDLLSMIGVAIETSAIFDRPLKIPSYNVIYSSKECKDYIAVSSNTADCIGYYAQIIENIKIAPSPWWLVSRLIAFGIRPINNVVDVTNYVLALFGQPLHAFDYRKLGRQITIRKAKDNETFVTLDGEKRMLESEDLLITDGKKPVALAGVMGGLNTEIDNSTETVVLEAAVFNPISVSKTSRRLDLRSESSIRFEKGVNINQTKKAMDYAAYLLQTFFHAKVLKNPVFVGTKNIPSTKIAISIDDVNNKLGTSITDNDIQNICRRLKFPIDTKGIVSVPNRRPDVKIKEDLIEEIGRIYGYDKISETLPAMPSIGILNDRQKIRRKIKNILCGLGLNQIITYSLTEESNNQIFNLLTPKGSEAIKLLNPMTAARQFLRKSLLPNLINNAKYCYSHKMNDLAIFEIGKVFYQCGDYFENEHLALLFTKRHAETLWQLPNGDVDFYYVKGICSELFCKIGIKGDFLPLNIVCNQLHPQRSALIYFNNEIIGYIGALHPQFAAKQDLDEIYVVEVNLSPILSRKIEPIRYKPFSKYPSIERDIAVIVERGVEAGQLVDTIRQSGNMYLNKIGIFDVYTGNQIKPSEKSIAIKLTFSANRALTDNEINEMVDDIIEKLRYKHQAKLRDK